MKIFNFLRGLKKRQANPAAALSTSFPYGTGLGGLSRANNIASIKRCVSIYANFLKILQLEPEDHYLTKLIENGPHPAINKNTFYDFLCWDAKIYGQHISRLKFDGRGRISAFLPYINRGALAYPREGGFDDPAKILTKGFYYRSHLDSAVWERDECFHFRDSSSGDLLNAYPPAFDVKGNFDTAGAVQNVLRGLAYSGGRGAVMIEGFALSDKEEDKTVRKIFKEQLQQGLADTTSQVITMPQGFKPHALLQQNSHALIPWIAEHSLLEISQIFNVPHELLVVGKTSLQSLKEITRHFVRTTLRAYVDSVAKEITKAAGDGATFSYNLASLRHSDARETSQFLAQLVQTEVLSPKEAKEILEDDL